MQLKELNEKVKSEWEIVSEEGVLIMPKRIRLSKPDPALFLLACDKLGVKPENTLMVGDSQGDIAMAKNAKASGVIGICGKNPQANHLAEADVIISDLADLKLI